MGGAIVWISGASSGIGAALATTVPYLDARIIGISRRPGPAGEHLEADLADPASWRAVGASFRDELASFDGDRAIFVHCAASLEPMSFARDADPEEYARTTLLNSAAPLALGQAFVHAARDLPHRSDVVMLTSGAATSVYEGWSLYGPAKAAVDHWVRHVGAEELRRGSHCRILAMAPGVVATAMQEQIRATDESDFPRVERFKQLHADDELRRPEDAARDVWALLDSDVDNGAVIDVRQLRPGKAAADRDAAQ